MCRQAAAQKTPHMHQAPSANLQRDSSHDLISSSKNMTSWPWFTWSHAAWSFKSFSREVANPQTALVQLEVQAGAKVCVSIRSQSKFRWGLLSTSKVRTAWSAVSDTRRLITYMKPASTARRQRLEVVHSICFQQQMDFRAFATNIKVSEQRSSWTIRLPQEVLQQLHQAMCCSGRPCQTLFRNGACQTVRQSFLFLLHWVQLFCWWRVTSGTHWLICHAARQSFSAAREAGKYSQS